MALWEKSVVKQKYVWNLALPPVTLQRTCCCPKQIFWASEALLISRGAQLLHFMGLQFHPWFLRVFTFRMPLYFWDSIPLHQLHWTSPETGPSVPLFALPCHAADTNLYQAPQKLTGTATSQKHFLCLHSSTCSVKWLRRSWDEDCLFPWSCLWGSGTTLVSWERSRCCPEGTGRAGRESFRKAAGRKALHAGGKMRCLRVNAAPGQGWAGGQPPFRGQERSFPLCDKGRDFPWITGETLSLRR